MASDSRKNVLEAFCRNAPHLTEKRINSIINMLRGHEIKLRSINEIHCGVDLSNKPLEKAKLAKDEEETEVKVRKLVDELKFKVEFGGDPRGSAIKIKMPDKSFNCWDGESWEMYW